MRNSSTVFLLGLVAGLLALPAWPRLPLAWPWLVALIPVFGLAWWCRNRLWRFQMLLLLAGALSGVAWSVWQAEAVLAGRWSGAGEPISAEGRLIGLPEGRDGVSRFRFRPECQRWPAAERCTPYTAGADWLVSWRQAPVLAPGQRWQLWLNLRPVHGTVNPGLSARESWYLAERIGATATVARGRLLGAAPAPVETLRVQLRQRLWAQFPERSETGVLLALLTGDRSTVTPVRWRRYQEAGISHLLAISGTHVTLVAVLAGLLAYPLLRRFTRLTRRWPAPILSAWWGYAVAVGYGFLAGASIPTVRTLLMLGLAVLALSWLRQVAVHQILLLTLALMLLLDPLASLQVSFWLSFGAVALILWFMSGDWRRLGQLAAWGRVQLLLAVALLPLSLFFFGQTNVLSPLLNLLAIPLVTFLVVPLAMLGALLSGVSMALASDVWQLALWLLQGLDGAVDLTLVWPAARWHWGLSLGELVWALLLVILLLLPRPWPGRWLALLLVLPLIKADQAPATGALTMTVLDVGQGLAIVLSTHAKTLLYDAGPRWEDRDMGREVVLPYLAARGVRRLDRVIASHDDLDHVGGLTSVYASLPVTEVLGVPPEPPLPTRPCQAGQVWQWDGVRFRILAPSASATADRPDNERSCVLEVVVAGRRLLITGDLGAAGERELVREYGAALASTVLLVGHHGSRHSSDPGFLQEVRPKWAIVSAGRFNRYGHPHPLVLERLRTVGAQVEQTASGGAITVRIAPDGGVSVQAERRSRWRNWLINP